MMALLVSRQDATSMGVSPARGSQQESYPTLPPCNPCHPCNRSLLEAYSYRPSSLPSTRSISRARSAQINKARHRVSSRSHMRRPHPDRFARTAVRILRLSAAPHRFLVYTFPLQSRTPAPVALLGDCFLAHLPHMLNQETVLDPLASPASLSSFYFQLPLLSLTLLSLPLLTPLTTIRTFWSPPLSCKELRNVTGLNVETSGLAMDASTRVASYLDPV
jgi:hypothetical protein